MSQENKIGIIGGGMISQTCHIPFYLRNPDCEVVAIADSRPSLVRYIKSNFKFENVVSHYRDILNDKTIDAVILSAPRPAVGPLTLEILNSGKHVITEKPMAHSVKQAETLVKVAKEKNLIYAVGFMKRHDPGIVKAREIFAELMQGGRLGRLLFARFYDHSKSTIFSPPPHQRPEESRSERFETWPVYPDWMPEIFRENFSWFMNTASHDINLMHLFFGKDLTVATASISTNGSVSASLMSADTLISFETSKTEAGKWLQGGEFMFEGGKLDIEVPSPMDLKGISAVFLTEKGGTGTRTPLETGLGWSFEKQADYFVDVLNHSVPPATSGEDALFEMELMETIWRKGLEIY